MLYSAITNDYDEPREDVKCFTKYNRFRNPRLNAKIYKVLPHLFMPKEDWWIWMDGNVTLKDGAVKKLLDLAGDSITVFSNPYRDNVGDEMEEIKNLKLDKASIIDRLTYDKTLPLPACCLIIRKNTEKVRRANERWWAEICHGSVRDQISFATAYPFARYLPKINLFDNEYFKRGHGHKRERTI